MIKHIHLDRCDSTQDIAKEQLNHNPDQELLISCNFQESGRGRGINRWEDGPGTICFSMSIEPHAKPSLTALEMSVLICRFFEEGGHHLKLKWPNDLLNKNEIKCGGILVLGHHHKYIAGIGINLFWQGEVFGGIHDQYFEFDKSKWSMEMATYIENNRYKNTDKLISDWTDRCYHLNQMVTILEDKTNIDGLFIGLGENGEALIKTDNKVISIYNGTLRLL